MNRLATKALLTLSLIFTGLATAQAPGTFQNVQHHVSDISTVVNDTWKSYAASGFTGDVRAMTRMSVTYLFHQGDQQLLVTVRQVDGGVTIYNRKYEPGTPRQQPVKHLKSQREKPKE